MTAPKPDRRDAATGDVALLAGQDLRRCHPSEPRRLLDDVSIEVCAGECLAIEGRSGSGKSLLLRALAWLDPLDHGYVCWQGTPVDRDEIPVFRAQAVYLHQRPALPEGTVEDSLRGPFGLAVHRGRSFDPQRIAEWLDQMEIDAALLNSSTGDLSGGERQVVSLMRTLQLDPAVLLLDEPTAAMDPTTTGATERLLAGWLAESPDDRAMVWVTHDADQARRVADLVLRMDEGRLADDTDHA